MKKFSRDEPIETEAEHEAALKRIDQLMDATEGSPEAEELSDLADAVCLYENEHFSLDSKYEEIQKLIEQLGSILYNGFHSGDRKSFELVHRAYESLSSLLEENKRMKEALVPFLVDVPNNFGEENDDDLFAVTVRGRAIRCAVAALKEVRQ